MTAVNDPNGTLDAPHLNRVEALSLATARVRFDPFVDIDWTHPRTRWTRTIRVGSWIRMPLRSRLRIGMPSSR